MAITSYQILFGSLLMIIIGIVYNKPKISFYNCKNGGLYAWGKK